MKQKENLEHKKTSKFDLLEPQYSKSKNTKLMTSFILSIIIIIMLCGYSMAKCIDEYIIKGRMKIAEPILEIENNPIINITESQNYGEYIFKIRNYNNKEKVTETELKYYIEISPKLDNSIDLELYQNEDKIELTDNKTKYIKISKEQKEEREYKIKITYDKNTAEVGDILEQIQVKVHTEQEKA